MDDVLEKEIIRILLDNNKISQREIAVKTKKAVPTVQRHMRKLIKQGKIRREGGKRFGTWKVLSEKDFDKTI